MIPDNIILSEDPKINLHIYNIIDWTKNFKCSNFMIFVILVGWKSGKRNFIDYCTIRFFKYICTV